MEYEAQMKAVAIVVAGVLVAGFIMHTFAATVSLLGSAQGGYTGN